MMPQDEKTVAPPANVPYAQGFKGGRDGNQQPNEPDPALCSFDSISDNGRAHRRALGRAKLVSVAETLTAGFRKTEHPLEGIWADFDELHPAMQTDSVASMRNQTYVFERTKAVDEVFDNKSMIEDWFREHIQRVFICPLVSSSKDELLGVMLLIESANASNTRHGVPWFQRLSEGDSLPEETILPAPGRDGATQKRAWKQALEQAQTHATLLMEQAETRDRVFVH